MNEKTLKGKWQQLQGKIQEKWGALTEEDMLNIAGNKDKLLEKIQEIYGYSKQEAKAEWDRFSEMASSTIQGLEEEASSTCEKMGDNIQSFVRNSPFKAVGIAALAGLLLGLRF